MAKEIAKAARVENPMEVIQRAIDSNVDAANLERLIAMYERIEKMNAERAYNASMRDCQAELFNVVHDSKNTHNNSTFAELSTVITRLKPIWTHHGFAISFYEGEPMKKEWIRVCADVMHVGGHTKLHYIELPVDGQGSQGSRSGMNPVQGVGSSHSYARRYLIFDIFNLSHSERDLDGVGVEVTVNDDQAEWIHKMLNETGADVEGFMRWAGVAKVEELPQARFVDAKRLLLKKKEKA